MVSGWSAVSALTLLSPLCLQDVGSVRGTTAACAAARPRPSATSVPAPSVGSTRRGRWPPPRWKAVPAAPATTPSAPWAPAAPARHSRGAPPPTPSGSKRSRSRSRSKRRRSDGRLPLYLIPCAVRCRAAPPLPPEGAHHEREYRAFYLTSVTAAARSGDTDHHSVGTGRGWFPIAAAWKGHE